MDGNWRADDDERWKFETSKPGVVFHQAEKLFLHGWRSLHSAEDLGQNLLKSKQAEVEDDGSVGDDDQAVRWLEREARFCSNISGVNDGIRRRNSSSSKAKRSNPAMAAATLLEILPLEKRATASSSCNSDSLNEARAGSSGKVEIMG